eukprot:2278118-Amphidinium_carterae.1
MHQRAQAPRGVASAFPETLQGLSYDLGAIFYDNFCFDQHPALLSALCDFWMHAFEFGHWYWVPCLVSSTSLTLRSSCCYLAPSL